MNDTTCGWKCGDETPAHKHYAVVVRENGKLLGRLTPDGTCTHRTIYASVLSKTKAESIVAEINGNPPFPGVTARVTLF